MVLWVAGRPERVVLTTLQPVIFHHALDTEEGILSCDCTFLCMPIAMYTSFQHLTNEFFI